MTPFAALLAVAALAAGCPGPPAHAAARQLPHAHTAAAAPAVIAHAARITVGGEENTTAQIIRLGKAGVRRVEVDVRYSRTGWPVLMHDATVDRTTDGHGYVYKLSVTAMAKMRPPVPTLGKALAAARQYRMDVLLDLKTNGATATQLRQTGSVIVKSGWRSHVTMIADAGIASRRAMLHAYHGQGIRTGWVETYPGRPRTAAEISAGTGDARPYWLISASTPPAVLDELAAAGVVVTVGTPNDVAGWEAAQGHGVDSVFSDRAPAYLSWLRGATVRLDQRFPDGDLG